MLSYVDFVQSKRQRALEITLTLQALGTNTGGGGDTDDTRPPIQKARGHYEAIAAVQRDKLQWFRHQQHASQSTDSETQQRIDVRVHYAFRILQTYIQAIIKRDPGSDLGRLCETRRLTGSYYSAALEAKVGVDAPAAAKRVKPYDVREWAIPNNPSIKLARRIRARTPGEEPAIGERFSFIKIVDLTHADTRSEQVETLEYALAHQLPIDVVAYLLKDGRPFQKLMAVLGAGLACGEMIDGFIADETERVNRLIAQDRAVKSEAAKRAFLAGGLVPTAVQVVHKKRTLKASAASKARATADLATAQSHFRSFFKTSAASE